MNFIDLITQTQKIKNGVDDRFSQIMKNASYINGADVEEFEEKSAAYLGYKFGIGVSSGTDALLVTMMALGVSKGTRVFIPAYTYTASAEAIVLLGAQPVFVDVDEGSFLLCPNALESALKTYAQKDDLVMAVDLFGQPCDYDRIVPIARQSGCKVFIDGAQSFGNSYKGSSCIGGVEAFCTSFFPAKPLGCFGDGGAIYSNNEALSLKMRSIKNHGMGADKYDIKFVGINGRLDTLQAAVLIEKLKIFDFEISAKKKILETYTSKLQGVLGPQRLGYETKSALAQAVFTLPENIPNDRFVSALAQAGVPSMIYYPKTVADQTAYSDGAIAADGLEISRRLTKKTVALPFHAYLTDNEIDLVCDIVLATVKQLSDPHILSCS